MFDAKNEQIFNVPDPAIEHHAANKRYVDNKFVWLNGQSGGQTIYGGTDAGDDLYLKSTSNATKGYVYLGGTVYLEESTGRLKSLTDPTDAQDAATKNYVDGLVVAPTIVLHALQGHADANNKKVRHLTLSGNDIYWATETSSPPSQCYLGWAYKPTGFDSPIGHKVASGDGNNQYGIVKVGTDIFVSDEGSLHDLSRYDEKTFANREDWGWTGTATKGMMVYDGSTYIYIVDYSNANRIRRYTIDDTNNNFDQDTDWVDAPYDYKILPKYINGGFWCDGTYFYGYETASDAIYKIQISNLTVVDSVALDSNISGTDTEPVSSADIVGIVKIGSQFYMFMRKQFEESGGYLYTGLLIGYPFSF